MISLDSFDFMLATIVLIRRKVITFIKFCRKLIFQRRRSSVWSSGLQLFHFCSRLKINMNVLKCFCSTAVRSLSRSNYTSTISLKNLHPKSSLKLTTPTPDQVCNTAIGELISSHKNLKPAENNKKPVLPFTNIWEGLIKDGNFNSTTKCWTDKKI